MTAARPGPSEKVRASSWLASMPVARARRVSTTSKAVRTQLEASSISSGSLEWVTTPWGALTSAVSHSSQASVDRRRSSG